uniref:Uncharacterized protein n=1 Tax=Anopheles farauti TaxID=69004 RepID=A0A182QA64_9DIPT
MNMIIALGCVLTLLWTNLVTVDGVMYEFLLTSFEAVPQELDDMMDYGTIRLTRQGKNQVGVAGSFSVFKNAGSETQVRWTVYKIDFLGHKRMFVNGAGSLCTIIANDEVIYPQLLEMSNLPPQDSCPFPKGNYTIFNYVFDEHRLPPALPASEWLMEAIVTRDGKIGGKLFRKASGTGGVPYISQTNTICRMAANDVLIYPQLMAHSNLPPQGTCPIPKGNYTVDNFLIDLKKLPHVIPYDDDTMLAVGCSSELPTMALVKMTTDQLCCAFLRYATRVQFMGF